MFNMLRKIFGREEYQPSGGPDSDGGEYVEIVDERLLYNEIRKRCPDCHHYPPEYYEGPSGGMSTNIFCANCGQGYNVTPMVEVAERIHKDERYLKSVK